MRLFIAISPSQPSVVFDTEQAFFRIEGVSSLHDAEKFWDSIAQWLVERREAIRPKSELVLRLLYLNSASIKALYRFFLTLKKAQVKLRPILLLNENRNNEEEVYLLEQICQQLELPYEVREIDTPA